VCRITLILLLIFFKLACTPAAKAQLLYALERKQNAVSFSGGCYRYDPIFTTSLARGVKIHLGKIINKQMTLFADFADKSNFSNINEFKFAYGGQGYILQKKSFKILFRKTFTLSRITTPEINVTFLGGELEVMPGIYKPKFFTALDIYYGDSFRGMVIKNNSLNNTLYDIKSGWIRPHRAAFKLGLNVGYYLTPKFCVYGYISCFAHKPRHEIYQLPNVNGAIGFNYMFRFR
jgi:hypothetical protein